MAGAVRRVTGGTAAALMLLVVVLATTSCQDCELSCEAATSAPETITAEATSIDDSIVTFTPTDASSEPVDVVVSGSYDALDEGSTYLVPLHPTEIERENDDGSPRPITWEASLDSDCTCTSADITHADGAEIDTSIWAVYGPVHIPVGKALIVVALAFAVVVGAWALHRRRQGLPL